MSARPSFIPLSFTAVSATQWWVLGAVPCGDRDCLGLKTTTDGGTTFRSLPAPPATFAPGAPPAESSVRFADPDDGWVFGPRLYATHDGGLRWTAIAMPGVVATLQAGLGQLLHSTTAGATFAIEPQPVTGIACGYSPVSPAFLWAYCSGGHFMFPFISTDGGAHFTAVATQAARITPAGYANGSELIAASATTAVAAGDLSVPGLGTPLIRTIDEGAHWKVVQAQPGSNGMWSLIGFTTPEVGYALWQSFARGYATAERGYGTAELWRTTDAGAKWTPVTSLG